LNQIDWLREDIKALKADVDSQLTDIRSDVKSLLAFKWQMIGSTTIVSLIIGVVINIAIALASK
jgi:hypothetical protein